MAYTKKTWVTGETIEASELNHMEDGIETAQQTADNANARDTLGEMSDVTLSTPTNGQVLTYDSTSTKWKNADASGASTLNEMTDVTLSSPTDGQVLTYDSTSSKWKNASASGGASTLASLTDTDISGYIYNGAILRYNRSTQKWRNTTLELMSVATEGEDGILYVGSNAESPGNYVNTITISGMLVLMLYDAGGDLASVTPFTGAVYNQDGTITYKFGNITYTSDLNDDLMHRDT